MVAVIRRAITLGATVGGLFYDLDGYRSSFDISAAIFAPLLSLPTSDGVLGP